MEKVINISLNGHPMVFPSEETAYHALRRYLDNARTRLKDDPDHQEVLRDLEQSIGEKLAPLMASGAHVISVDEINAVLEEIGAVNGVVGSDISNATPNATKGPPQTRRRLYRIQEGQNLAGVCQGVAAYSKIRIDWVRTIAVLLTVFTGGVFALVYLVLMFALPVAATHKDYAAAQQVQQ
jgi:phage shock protein C